MSGTHVRMPGTQELKSFTPEKNGLKFVFGFNGTFQFNPDTITTFSLSGNIQSGDRLTMHWDLEQERSGVFAIDDMDIYHCTIHNKKMEGSIITKLKTDGDFLASEQ